jgi:hypothetical protein
MTVIRLVAKLRAHAKATADDPDAVIMREAAEQLAELHRSRNYHEALADRLLRTVRILALQLFVERSIRRVNERAMWLRPAVMFARGARVGLALRAIAKLGGVTARR